MKLVFIVSGEPLTITSHVSVVKNFLATDEIAGRDVNYMDNIYRYHDPQVSCRVEHRS